MSAMRRVFRPSDPFADPGPLIARVYGYVAYRIGHGADAEDATGETFARALRYRDSYDPAKGTPISWLIGIARRCVDESFKQPRPTADPPELAAPGDMATETADRLTLIAAVGQLGERDRELIALRYGADLSARQIAHRMGLSTNAVEVALHRARSLLRAMLATQPTGERSVKPDVAGVRITLPVSVPKSDHPNRGESSEAIFEAKP